ncbi:MAG: GIY-YIG nuclease family protein [Acidobacteria bacterium]|nr:GIY-YIG nuclease family protein [Acidobacteriota bacterium]
MQSSGGTGRVRRGELIPMGENRYRLKWYLGRASDGRRKYGSKMFYGSEEEAQLQLAEYVERFPRPDHSEARRKQWRETYEQCQAETIVKPQQKKNCQVDLYGVDEYVYAVELQAPVAERPIKIGRAVDVEKRMRSLLTSCPYPLKIVALWRPTARWNTEFFLQCRHKRDRLRGEWFRPSPALLAEIAQCTERHSLVGKIYGEGR